VPPVPARIVGRLISSAFLWKTTALSRMTPRPMTTPVAITRGLLLIGFSALALAADQPGVIEIGRFSAVPPGNALPSGWQPIAFAEVERHTVYRLVQEDGATVVRAEAQSSASGLIRRIEIDLREYPILAWRWKIANVIENGDARRKEGDDYAGRVYVIFKYDSSRVSLLDRAKYGLATLAYGEEPPHAGINYVWDNRLPPGTTLPNAYSDRVRMMVLRSGAAEAGRWVAEERNVHTDYKRMFNEEPPLVSGVAIMTDADNTRSAATAWYGDFAFKRRRE
jgi:hypothetical protein